MMVSAVFSIPCPVNPTEDIPGVVPDCGGNQCPPTDDGGDGLAFVTTSDSDTITFTGNGTPESPLHAELVLDPTGVFTRIEFVFYSGGVSLAAATPVIAYVAPEETRFPVNFADSIGAGSNAATGDIDVQKNGAPVGQIKVLNGVVTFTSAGFVLARGDMLTLVPTATFAPQSLAVTLVAFVPVTYDTE